MDQLPHLKHGLLTEAIIGSFYDVYNELGHGFLESIYGEAMAVTLPARGLRIEREKAVTVHFRGVAVGLFRMDLVVAGCIVVELKSARTIDPWHEAQLLNYLKATGFEVGLLFNFGPRPQFRRMVFSNSSKPFDPSANNDTDGTPASPQV